MRRLRKKSGWGDRYLDGHDLPDEDYTTGRLLNDASTHRKPSGLRFSGSSSR